MGVGGGGVWGGGTQRTFFVRELGRQPVRIALRPIKGGRVWDGLFTILIVINCQKQSLKIFFFDVKIIFVKHIKNFINFESSWPIFIYIKKNIFNLHVSTHFIRVICIFTILLKFSLFHPVYILPLVKLRTFHIFFWKHNGIYILVIFHFIRLFYNFYLKFNVWNKKKIKKWKIKVLG